MPESRGRPVLAVAAVLTALVILILAAVGIPVRADPGESAHQNAVDAGGQGADAVITKMNAAYRGLQSFEAKFIQTSSGISFPTPLVQEGTLQVQKPDKLRWQFMTPNPRLFLSDGSSLWVVDEKEKTCTHYSSMMEPLQRFLAFFNGMEKLGEHYEVKRVNEGPEKRPGADTLELRPKVKDGSVAVLYLHVDESTGLLKGVVTVSAFGDRTETSLQGTQRGAALPPERFRWDERPGFQLIEAS